MDENKEPRGYTFTAKLNDFDVAWSGQPTFTELEDMTDYILEEDREAVNKYIEELQKHIRKQNNEIARLRGQVETWEKSWRIWNGEE